MGTAELSALHEQFKAEAILLFTTAKKMGGSDMSQQFLHNLNDEIEVSNG